jgi:phosphoribosylformimino-5-aminoimidazole carboxamide ribotide isomerase
MRFRPCIDIHNGSVKQIVGGSLQDQGDRAKDNFVSRYDGGFYGDLYRRDGFRGGHIILLNPVGSPWYEKDVEQAKLALEAYPGGLQLGGGITGENAEKFLDMGASHVIVTSYVFRDGIVDYQRLSELSRQIGKEHLVLDLSCRRYGEGYYIVTDRWQKRTEEQLNRETMEHLREYCDEFLIHGVDVEGKQQGIEKPVISMLGQWQAGIVTYAGGIRSLEDLEYIREAGKDAIDFTIGSALDLFGGDMPYKSMLEYR